MINIFLSYRADDGVHASARISRMLAEHFGRDRVFRDHDSLELGSRYPDELRGALTRADVVIAIIGPNWLGARRGVSSRCVDDPRDWVRTELRTAFESRRRVVPVLLDDVPVPAHDELPPDIAEVSRLTYWRVRNRTLDADVHALIRLLDPSAVEDPPDAGHRAGTQVNYGMGGVLYANQGVQHIHGTPVRGER
ncbi:toll/interleukin-1 receptor domain-containing protein [Amycolatopsis sp. NPDC049252]|uniref:toll/interleukin-1 receptor domain-containing protein n=1 Tax=Amycolatopsis sp. NPDC049252 TaxID=3363933 RepID=UPI0037244F6D